MRVAAAFVLLAALVAACGSDSVADKRFAARGNAICRDTKTKTRAVERTKPNIDVKVLTEQTARGRKARQILDAYRARLSAVGRAGQRRLESLEPPAHLRDERETFFGDLARLQRVAAREGDAARSEAVEIINRLPDEARALGWTDCAG